MSLADGYENEKGRKGAKKRKATPFLDEFGEDLTLAASEGKLDPIIGRDKEIYRICQILARKKKNNPIILGEPGVGKTAIVEAIAQRIVSKKVARVLLNKRLVSINMANIVAGTKYRGEFEERMKNIVDEIKASPNVIIFIDEIHTIVGAGGVSGALDASNILKPALARGSVQCIGATTLDEYRENIEDDGALTRRFQEVFVESPSTADTIEILTRIKGSYEEHHSVEYTEEAIIACVKLSERYIKQRELPDKAIDLLDESGARTHLMEVKMPAKIKDLEKSTEVIRLKKSAAVESQDYELAAALRDKQLKVESTIIEEVEKWEASLKTKRRQVTIDDILETISMQTGIPINKLGADDLKMIKDMSKELKKRIIGQDDAVDALTQVIKRSRTGVASHNKPIGSFMFLGATGVGKTETVKALAEYMFGEADAMIRIDMSEYQEKFNVSRLIGSPPGYVGHEDGGQLTEAVRRKPYSVVLFDEIEKAHPDTFNTLLQVLDEGRLTDSLGREVDFTNTIIIMTSNVGARKVQDFGSGVGFSSTSSVVQESAKAEAVIKKELKNKFSPEFLNRVDKLVLFGQLSHDNILNIVDIELNNFNERMEESGYTFKFTKAAKDFLAVEGYDAAYGARPVKRAIQKYVEDLVADSILEEKLVSGKTYTINKIKADSKLTLK
ncbi:ATP-dependent Clp protease ATP-binding subunit [bacterium]|nr:ATP-dependent Clp protease ATP-binding subunit [bacterium]